MACTLSRKWQSLSWTSVAEHVPWFVAEPTRNITCTNKLSFMIVFPQSKLLTPCGIEASIEIQLEKLGTHQKGACEPEKPRNHCLVTMPWCLKTRVISQSFHPSGFCMCWD